MCWVYWVYCLTHCGRPLLLWGVPLVVYLDAVSAFVLDSDPDFVLVLVLDFVPDLDFGRVLDFVLVPVLGSFLVLHP